MCWGALFVIAGAIVVLLLGLAAILFLGLFRELPK